MLEHEVSFKEDFIISTIALLIVNILFQGSVYFMFLNGFGNPENWNNSGPSILFLPFMIFYLMEVYNGETMNLVVFLFFTTAIQFTNIIFYSDLVLTHYKRRRR